MADHDVQERLPPPSPNFVLGHSDVQLQDRSDALLTSSADHPPPARVVPECVAQAPILGRLVAGATVVESGEAGQSGSITTRGPSVQCDSITANLRPDERLSRDIVSVLEPCMVSSSARSRRAMDSFRALSTSSFASEVVRSFVAKGCDPLGRMGLGTSFTAHPSVYEAGPLRSAIDSGLRMSAMVVTDLVMSWCHLRTATMSGVERVHRDLQYIKSSFTLAWEYALLDNPLPHSDDEIISEQYIYAPDHLYWWVVIWHLLPVVGRATRWLALLREQEGRLSKDARVVGDTVSYSAWKSSSSLSAAVSQLTHVLGRSAGRREDIKFGGGAPGARSGNRAQRRVRGGGGGLRSGGENSVVRMPDSSASVQHSGMHHGASSDPCAPSMRRSAPLGAIGPSFGGREQEPRFKPPGGGNGGRWGGRGRFPGRGGLSGHGGADNPKPSED